MMELQNKLKPQLEVRNLLDTGTMKIYANKQMIELDIKSILYVRMERNYAYVYMSSGAVYETRTQFWKFEEKLGDFFITVKRGCLVSPLAMHDVSREIDLCNGKTVYYVKRRKKELKKLLAERRKSIIDSFDTRGVPRTAEEYRSHYRLFECMPFAFCDIEMVFNPEFRAVDWTFRYGNQALADLEKMPLESLIGNSFADVFPNMDAKWLRSYERATLYGEALRIVDYSAEIDTYLDVICFPTFEGHCGCILFNIAEINSVRKTTDTERALAMLLDKLSNGSASEIVSGNTNRMGGFVNMDEGADESIIESTDESK